MIFSSSVPWLLLAALVLDAIAGDPDWLWRRLPHPVVWFGTLIRAFDTSINSERYSAPRRRLHGIFTVGAILAVAIAAGAAIQSLAALHWTGQAIEIVVVAILIAQRSLYDHVARVARAFSTGSLHDARSAVSMVVGRDPETLDEAGVARAAIETTAENFSDGVIAPAFWYLVAGLPGIVAYKMINTADSMIGHRSDRYRDFGWAAARLDDVLNLVPARLTGVFVALAAPVAEGSITHSLRVMLRDATKHKSPNAGWPEAAMAGALGLALAGPRTYAGTVVGDPWLNDDGNKRAIPADIWRALRVYVGAAIVHAGLVGLLAAIV